MVSLVLGFILGLLYALFFAFILAIGSAFQPYGADEFGVASFGMVIVFMPLFFAFFSAIFNSIAALVSVLAYNFVARTMGGLEYDVEIINGGTLKGLASQPQTPRPGQSESFPVGQPPPAPRQDEPPADFNI
jgi:hypothetical protein